MGASIIAIIGTLLGATVTAVLQRYITDRSESAARSDRLQHDRMEAVTALACAATDHRRTMYTRTALQQQGADQGRQDAATADSYATRSAIARPMVTLKLLIADPAVRALADDMVCATYGMRDATDPEDLNERRFAALATHNVFVDTAGAYLAGL